MLKNTDTPIEWEGFTPYSQRRPRPPLKQHKEVAVDPKVLDRYVGRYGLPPDIVLAITREGNQLFVQENDEPKQELGSESEVQFFSKSTDDEYTFEVNSQGRATKMTLHTDDKDIPMMRLD